MSVEYKNIKETGTTSSSFNWVQNYQLSSGRTATITSINLCNTSTALQYVSLYLRNAAGTYQSIFQDIPIDGEATLEVIDGQKIVLLAGDTIYNTCPAGSIDIVVSLMEIY
tara:strand:- start:1902 stop:2234 length:333 start_codon:yes stop_codon:yes gene_type:complete